MVGKLFMVVALVLSLADGCEKGQGGSPPEKRPPQFEEAEIESMCSVNVFAAIPHNPHQSKNSPEFMVGKAWLTCTDSVTNAFIEVKIQRKVDAGRWIDHTAMTRKCGPFAMTAAAPKQTCQHESLPCPKNYPDSMFRTAARAEGVHEGKAAGMTPWKTSGEVRVPCK